MIAKNMDSFTLGVDSYPDWFMEVSKNRVFYKISSESQTLISVELVNKTGNVTAVIGDTIAWLGDDFLVIPKDAANKYM